MFVFSVFLSVHYRVFGVTAGMKPIGGDDNQASHIIIDIVVQFNMLTPSCINLHNMNMKKDIFTLAMFFSMAHINMVVG